MVGIIFLLLPLFLFISITIDCTVTSIDQIVLESKLVLATGFFTIFVFSVASADLLNRAEQLHEHRLAWLFDIDHRGELFECKQWGLVRVDALLKERYSILSLPDSILFQRVNRMILWNNAYWRFRRISCLLEMLRKSTTLFPRPIWSLSLLSWTAIDRTVAWATIALRYRDQAGFPIIYLPTTLGFHDEHYLQAGVSSLRFMSMGKSSCQ